MSGPHEDQPLLAALPLANIKLADVLDAPAIQELMAAYFSSSGLAFSIVDTAGAVLVSGGYQDVCARFHRSYPGSCELCRENLCSPPLDIAPGSFKTYRCKNNMWVVATPVMLEESRIGTIFISQLFFDDEELDFELFRSQARRFGYDETSYLAALAHLPRCSRKTVEQAMEFCVKLAQLISRSNYNAAVLADALAKKTLAEESLRENEATFRKLFEDSHDPKFLLDAAGLFVECNQAALDILKLSREQLLGLSPALISPDIQPDGRSSAEAAAEVLALAVHGTPCRFEWNCLDSTGSEFVVEVSLDPLVLRGEPMFYATWRDITGRKETEAALKESNELFSVFMAHTPVYAYIKEVSATESRVLRASDNFSKMIGVGGSDLAGKEMRELFPSELAERIVADDWLVVSRGQELTLDEELNGRSYTTIKFPIGHQGRTLLAGFTIDISERKAMEQALLESETTFRKLFEDSADAILLIDDRGVFVQCNQAALDLLKLSREQFLLKSPADFSPKYQPDGRCSQEAAGELITQAFSNGLLRFDWTHINSEGGEFIVEISLLPITLKGQPLLHVTWRDITERKRSEKALQLSEQKFSKLFNLMPDMLGITSQADGRFIELNAGFERWTGWSREEALGRSSQELGLGEPGVREEVITLLQEQGQLDDFAFTLKTRSGELRDAIMYLLPISVDGEACVYFMARDVTEHKRAVEARIDMEKQLLHAQKLESLGVLAGGIAHDFNNILTAIMGNVSAARMDLDVADYAYAALTRAEKAVDRAAVLAKQLLVFAKGGNPVRKPLSVVQPLRDVIALTLSGSLVEPVVALPVDLYAVNGDEGQLSQAFHNITLNALQSMPLGGRLTVAAANVSLAADNGTGLPAGGYVKIVFSDEGCGIPADSIEKIFDPYFTTKPGGSGLGLASSYIIIKKHGGHIMVDSAPGKGTTFTLYLPGCAPALEAGGAAAPAPAEKAPAILVMDDDEMVRELAEITLKRVGCRVVCCEHGAAAIDLYRAAKEAGAPFDLVIMDLTIPGGMGGVEAARQILQLDQGARLIVSSGYSDDPVMANFRDYGFCAALEKPYNVAEIGKILAEAGRN